MQTSLEILFEKYEIVGCLKKDSHNAVYVANHIYLGKKIILKTLNTHELQDNIILERFKREAKILARMDHPNLIKILDFGTYGDHFYISFEYFESNNLRYLIALNQLSYEEKHRLLVQLLKALNIAHQNNIVHRDLKPENILVNENSDLKIADFGLAIILNDSALTNKASIVGTPGYMSPEQIKGDILTVKSDIFSAGVVAIELFTGKNPFLGKHINETINNILSFREESVAELVKGLQPAIQQVIKLMLKKNPADRGNNINEILNLLGVASEIYTPVELKLTRKKKNKVIITAASLASFILAISAIFFFNAGDNPVRSAEGNEKQLNLMEFSNLQPKQEPLADTAVFSQKQISVPSSPGRLLVEVTPWAEVFINNKKISTTPLNEYLKLSPGTYNLKLVHPDYPVYTKRIKIESDEIERINIDFKEITGFLDCKIYPWGEVYINDEFKSQTPFREPIMLMPGKYKLTIKNPRFGSITEDIRIKSKDVTEFQFNFEKNQNY
jgi:eukaryotic-like serine/threonine-protein kinase